MREFFAASSSCKNEFRFVITRSLRREAVAWDIVEPGRDSGGGAGVTSLGSSGAGAGGSGGSGDISRLVRLLVRLCLSRRFLGMQELEFLSSMFVIVNKWDFNNRTLDNFVN